MSLVKKSLSKSLNEFLTESEKLLHLLNSGKTKLTVQDLEPLAHKTMELRTLTLQMMREHLDEESFYNAEIVKETLELPLSLQGRRISFLEAADLALKHQDISVLKMILHAWHFDRSHFEVFYTDLRQIAQELAA